MEHIEDYLNISEPIGYDNSVVDITYIMQQPRQGTDINSNTPTVITIEPTSNWLLPAESYLYIEGKLLKSDGTRIQPLAERVWPDYALLNNFFPYLYNNLKYSLNDVEIESYNNPGPCVTIKNLITKPRDYNGLDAGWEIDTYDGQASHINAAYEDMKTYVDADFVSAGATPTADEHDTFCQQIFTDFNDANPLNQVTPYEVGYIASLLSNPPTTIECLNVINAMRTRFSNFLKSPRIPVCTTDPTAVTKVVLVPYYNEQLVKAVNTSISQLTTDIYSFNSGFKKRKEFLFDTVSSVMVNDEAGDFSFRIPLSYLFNFCEDYRKVIFNSKHEIQLARQTQYMPVLKSTTITDDAKVQLDHIRWYMPVIKPNLTMEALMLNQIKDGIEVDLAFMNKKIDVFNLPANFSNYTALINYTSGIEKPRYLIAGFQTVDTANVTSTNDQILNYALFNKVDPKSGSNLMIDLYSVNVLINGVSYQLMDYDNNFNQNKIAKWYNEYKKFKKSYRSDFEEDDMITFYEFRNLYRLYVFDISKQTEQLMSTGVANVSLEFHFNQPTTAPPATMKNQLFVVSFFDRAWKLKSDGTKQIVIK